MSAQDVQLGIEIEFLPYSSDVTRDELLAIVDNLPVHPTGWRIGTDWPNLEARTDGTISMGDIYEHLTIFDEWIHQIWSPLYGSPHFNHYTGMHVHVNATNRHVGEKIDPFTCAAAYYSLVHRFRAAVIDTRRLYPWYDERHEQRFPYNSLVDPRSRELFAATIFNTLEVVFNHLGTTEFRLWDARVGVSHTTNQRAAAITSLVEEAYNPSPITRQIRGRMLTQNRRTRYQYGPPSWVTS